MNEKTRKQLISFFKKYNLIKYKKGQILFRPGENIPGIAFTKSGYVRVYTIAKDGREITFPMLTPLFFCSLVNALTKRENKYYFEAISPVEMWVAPTNDLLDYAKKDADLYDKLTRSMIIDFMDLTNNIQQLIFGDAYVKIANLIYTIADKFGENKNKDETIITFNTPHRMLASMTGLTRETVTLQILKLQKEGFIYNKGRHIVIRNMNKLKDVAQV
jgi:CRP/FNR family transcriptional regulator, cyclic AMP receptor protein